MSTTPLPPLPLPPHYRLTHDRAASLKYRDAIVAGLLDNPKIYWGTERTRDVVSSQIESAWNCVCVLYDDDEEEEQGDGEERLAGWCRVVGDGVGIAYLADLFILPGHEGKGLAKALAREVTENSGGPGRGRELKWCLWTANAHKLYKRYCDFTDPKDYGWAMQRRFPFPREPPTLAQGYRLDTTLACRQKYMNAIQDALLKDHPGIYWGRGRSRDTLRKQVEACGTVLLHAGGGEGRETVAGFARVVTDHVGFAYLCDVFILPAHANLGLSKALVYETIENTGGKGNSSAWKWWLWTGDAHKLYEQFGFTQPVDGEGRWALERMPPGDVGIVTG